MSTRAHVIVFAWLVVGLTASCSLRKLGNLAGDGGDPADDSSTSMTNDSGGHDVIVPLDGAEDVVSPGELGGSCASSDDCGSHFCADGVCCDSACAEGCYACSTDR